MSNTLLKREIFNKFEKNQICQKIYEVSTQIDRPVNWLTVLFEYGICLKHYLGYTAKSSGRDLFPKFINFTFSLFIGLHVYVLGH